MNLFRPSKSDIYQIQELAKLGCSQQDIAKILGITEGRLSVWKARYNQVSEPLKQKARPEYTILHPEYAPMIEEAFACAGIRYYRFKEEYRMSTGRYKYYYATLREIDLRATIDTLKKYVEAFKGCLNGAGKKKMVDLGELWKLILNLESRLALAFDPQTIKSLAAIAYFDDTEDLTTFSKEYGDQKIKTWEANGSYDFFLTRPIGELFNLSNISVESLQEHLKVMEGIVMDLNSGLQTVLEDNS